MLVVHVVSRWIGMYASEHKHIRQLQAGIYGLISGEASHCNSLFLQADIDSNMLTIRVVKADHQPDGAPEAGQKNIDSAEKDACGCRTNAGANCGCGDGECGLSGVGDKLAASSERKAPEPAANGPEATHAKSGSTWFAMERPRSFGKRVLRLPQSADVAHASASYKDGVLTITIPKKPNSGKATLVIS